MPRFVKTVTLVGDQDSGDNVCEVYGGCDDEPKANARLIAASPDLLQACEMLLAWDEYGGDAVSMLTDAVDAAREAVRRVGV